MADTGFLKRALNVARKAVQEHRQQFAELPRSMQTMLASWVEYMDSDRNQPYHDSWLKRYSHESELPEKRVRMHWALAMMHLGFQEQADAQQWKNYRKFKRSLRHNNEQHQRGDFKKLLALVDELRKQITAFSDAHPKLSPWLAPICLILARFAGKEGINAGAELGRFCTELDRLNIELTRLQSLVAAAAPEDVGAFEELAREARKKQEELEAELTGVRTQLGQFQAEAERLRTLRETDQRELDTLRREPGRRQKAETELQTKTNELDALKLSSQQREAVLEAELGTLRQERNQLAETLKREQRDWAEAETKMTAVVSDLRERMERIANQQGNAQAELVEQVRAELQTKTNELDALKLSSQQREAVLEAELGTLRARIAELESRTPPSADDQLNDLIALPAAGAPAPRRAGSGPGCGRGDGSSEAPVGRGDRDRVH